MSVPQRHAGNKVGSVNDTSSHSPHYKLQRANSDALSFSADSRATLKEEKKQEFQLNSPHSTECKILSSENESPEEDATKFMDIFNKRKAEIKKIEHHMHRKHRKTKKHASVKEHVLGLLRNKLFLSHYIINAVFCAIGQVYIFGVGFIVKAQLNNQNLSFSSALINLIYSLRGKKPDEDRSYLFDVKANKISKNITHVILSSYFYFHLHNSHPRKDACFGIRLLFFYCRFALFQ